VNTRAGLAFAVLAFSLLNGCATNSSRQQVLAAGSQVEVRSYQTRGYDTSDKIYVMRAVIATLQDLRFVIDKADDVVGVVSATKLDGYRLSMTVLVRTGVGQTTVRANAQFNLKAIEEPGPYRDFFRALDKGLFLDDNLLAGEEGSARQDIAGNKMAETGVFAYYGEAEAEADNGTQDRDLWARALVLVDGDENRRKARYIELRAEKLQAEDRTNRKSSLVRQVDSGIKQPVPSPTIQKPDEPGLEISGIYESEITSNSAQIFGPRYRHLTLIIEQNGVRVSARDERFDTRISGEIDGDIVRFEVENGRADGYYPARGEWRIEDGGNALFGKWHTHGGWIDAQGEWNLLRVE